MKSILIGFFFMLCFKMRSMKRIRRLVLVVAGCGGAIIWPSLLLAQYPGSAGDLSMAALSSSSSASSGSSSGSASGSASVSTGESYASSNTRSASDSGVGSISSEGEDAVIGWETHAAPTAIALRGQKATRKQVLIRKFRLEFAKTQIIETASQRPFQALSADRYLDQFSKELNEGLDRQSDLKSLGQDLALVRDAIDDRLDVVLSSYDARDAEPRRLFAITTSADISVPALRAEIGQLALKHELLEFGEYSLQAMGYYAK